MRVLNEIGVAFCCLIIISACTRQSPVSQATLAAYINNEENGLKKSRHDGGISISMAYHPRDIIVKQIIDGENFSPAQIDSVTQSLHSLEYFTLRLSNNSQEINTLFMNDPAKFHRVPEYLSSRIGGDIRLVHQQDTISVEDFLYVQTFNVSTSSDVTLAFRMPASIKEGTVQIIYNDSFFGTGLSIFEFQSDDIKNTPPLDLMNKL